MFDPQSVQALAAVIDAAAAHEARLLQVSVPPPSAAAELQTRPDLFLGAYRQHQLCGAIAVEAALAYGVDRVAGVADPMNITLLVVHPESQRQGLARALVQAVLNREAGVVLLVTVAALNLPALALYKSFGFVAYRQGQLGPENLPVLQLRSAP